MALHAKSDIVDPGILFAGRLKGYYVAPRLCRVNVLKVFEEARSRGEPFVKWYDPNDDTSHDGPLMFAHFMTMLYVSIHKPGMSVLFTKEGALKSSSVRFRNIRAYIYAHRIPLARRCNDMTKQTYGSKKWRSKAWEPLQEWLFEKPPRTPERLARLTAFGRDDDEFHTVVAQCLWRFAHAPNAPWGIAATQPDAYSAVPDFKKVLCCRIHIRLFFFSHFHYAYSHMNIPCLYTPHVYHMCVCYLQAYAFASGVRGCTGKDQLMNMDNYDKQIFILHRKLFHRYMKYKKIFKKATLELPLYQQAIADEIKSRRTKRTAVSSTPEKKRTDTPTSFLW